MSGAGSIAAVLAVVTSFTFFGAGQTSILLNATAQEKYDRLKKESTAVAQLILAARVSEDPKSEAQTTHKFLNAIYNKVYADLRFNRDGSLRTQEAGQLQKLVKNRVSEVLKYITESPAANRMAHIFDDDRLASMLERRLTDAEINDAKERFDTALDEFISKGADLTFDPLSKLLDAAGLTGLSQSVVKDLYASEMTRLSKEISSPLADSLFRVGSVPLASTIAKVAAVAERPVFDETSLPIDWDPVEARVREAERAHQRAKVILKERTGGEIVDQPKPGESLRVPFR
jgi:hypothetical protein